MLQRWITRTRAGKKTSLSYGHTANGPRRVARSSKVKYSCNYFPTCAYCVVSHGAVHARG